MLYLNIIFLSSFLSLHRYEWIASVFTDKLIKISLEKEQCIQKLSDALAPYEIGCEYLYLFSLRHEDGWQKSLVKYFRRLGKGAYRNGNYYHQKSHNSLPAVIVTVENGDSFYFLSPLSLWMGISLLAS